MGLASARVAGGHTPFPYCYNPNTTSNETTAQTNPDAYEGVARGEPSARITNGQDAKDGRLEDDPTYGDRSVDGASESTSAKYTRLPAHKEANTQVRSDTLTISMADTRVPEEAKD